MKINDLLFYTIIAVPAVVLLIGFVIEVSKIEETDIYDDTSDC